MANFVRTHHLVLSCNQEGKFYFPSGFRRALRCQFFLADGNVFLSEWAPLAGIHSHGIDEVERQLAALSSKDIESVFRLRSNENSVELARFFRESFRYPLSFILSLALFDAHTQSSPSNEIKLSTLLLSHHGVNEARLRVRQGYQCLKIKIGCAIEEEMKRIRNIEDAVPPGTKLRLDANQKLSFTDAKLLLQGLRLQYIEEPISELSRLAELYDLTGIDSALDESFGDSDSLQKLIHAKSRYLIIKASRFNNIFSLMNLCEEALSLGISPIFSPCFESRFYASLMEKLVNKLKIFEEHHGIYESIFLEAP